MLLSTNRLFENALVTLGGCGNSEHVITLNVFLVLFYYNYDLLIYALVNLYYIIYRHVLCFHSVVFYELYLHRNFLTRGIRAKQGILILLYASTKLNFGFCELWFSVNLGFDSSRVEIFTKKISFNVISASKSFFRNYRSNIQDITIAFGPYAYA